MSVVVQLVNPNFRQDGMTLVIFGEFQIVEMIIKELLWRKLRVLFKMG